MDGVARSEGIPIQHAVRRSGGTDAKTISLHGQGVPTVVLGVPARSIYTHVTLIQLDDYQSARRLVLAVLKRLDRAAVDSFTDFRASLPILKKSAGTSIRASRAPP